MKTFFSTDIIRYQGQDGEVPAEGTFSKMALYRWLQVTLPLTFVTLVIAILTLRNAEMRRQHQEHPEKWQRRKRMRVETKDTKPLTLELPMYNEPKIVT